jgi:type II secretory pathway pseudopilin PulG
MRVRAFIAAAIIAALAGPVLAQQAPVQRYGEKDKEKTPNELQAERDAQRAYQRSLGSVPEKPPVDPWGNARSVETPKGDAKAAAKTDPKTVPAKPKTKTGDAAKGDAAK